ncbi:hypothetical protein EJ05DRAFT_130438 [Pseudovirgaria hyperparasitica]|uniref:Uncharacterized protein n=1 Tax=Pseudovirgaria hyperparasitica TaxID=470096 RepID=A0A6A6W0V0_9PEZI|nr:uncharacterized protein EJ05DRAFT_130438 [Pseudovirgaria hyperparasitica]KAF2754701.1 hypothetical protein EJ05DRAFT_130438 [Pseudovirgaria hyperparasitica]
MSSSALASSSSSKHRFVLLTFAVSAAASSGFWSDIYNYKAPPPELGPPGAAGALRDKKQLPWEICGIVGAYLVTVLVALTLLLTVGKRMRRDAELSPLTLEIEMVKAGSQAFDITPVSPASTTRSWFQKKFHRTPSFRSGMSSPTSPTVQSVASFDHMVLKSDKEQRQREMERLYAAVMEHQDEQEARKSAQSMVTDPEVDQTSQDHRRPLQINTTAKHSDLYPSPQSATTPRSFSRPLHPMEPPRSARSTRFAEQQQPEERSSPQRNNAGARREPALSPLSPRKFLSRGPRRDSDASSSSKTRKSLHNLRISGPIQKYPGEQSDEEARTPLSPRFYDPPPPPALPSIPSPHDFATSQGTARNADSAYAQEARDQPAPLPSARIPRINTLAPPPALNISPAKSAASSTSTLPLRSYHDAAGLAPVPPTPTKTTYVQARKDKLSLTTPRTGMPNTPYSPYMPFTPITPVTPSHLVTRKDRKERKKMEGKRVLREDDMVKEEDELW